MESPLSFNSSENFRKKLLLRNLRPYGVEGSYQGNDSKKNTEVSIIDYSVIDSPPIEVEANIQEPKLIGLNKYTPLDSDFGNIVNINKNLGTQTNFGNYTFTQSFGSQLEIFGKRTEKEQLVKNQYSKDVGENQNTVNPNLNKQTKANEGNYGYQDSVNSDLEKKGNELEKFLRVLNKYGPTKMANGFGDTVTFDLESIGTRVGEYTYVSNGPEISAEQSRTNAYTSNFFGPSGGFGFEVEPNVNKQTKPNSGPFLYPTSEPNRTTERSQKMAYLSNVYGPEDIPNGYGVFIDPNLNFQTRSNQGEFDYESSSPNLTTLQSQTFFYGKNKYNSGEGTFDALTVEDYSFENLNDPYYNSDTTFIFIPSDYSPINILSQDDLNNVRGSEGSLSQDSDLAKLGAKQLQKEFKARVAFELLQQTLGKTLGTTTTVNQNSGAISAELKPDPFDALGVITNNIPLIQRDFKITSVGGIIGEALSFTSRLAGLYSPYSLIPGEYFDYPQKNILSQALTNPIGGLASLATNLATKILTPNIDTGSETLLANTSNATKSLLFDMLYYNEYRPQYKLSSVLSPNLTAPGGNFYIGKGKNYMRDLVSPKTDLPRDNKGNPVVGPVYSYGRIGKDYEGNSVNQKLFGLNARAFYDKVGIQGGFTWTAKKNYIDPGRLVGPKNEKTGKLQNFSIDSVFGAGFQATYNQTKSSDTKLTPGSILDVTQRLVEAGSVGSASKLEHVGNAINQVSKVFFDGYQEVTKGSRARRFLTPTSLGQSGKQVKDVVGYEYCRLFTKDRPYYSFNELQKTDRNIRKYNSSVLDNTYNLNIAPMGGVDSTNIQFIDGKLRAKKYMFSLENLAWKTSSRVGYRVEDLPACEIGPNGGRIMWFPPYDLTFDDSSTANWTDTAFLGRTEPVYTYTKTSRKGNISFKIVVDHPSVLNVLVNKELEKTEESLATKVIDSLFAGCLKYDLVDLLKKYPMFSYSDIYEVVETLRTVEQVREFTKYTSPTQTNGENNTKENAQLESNEESTGSETKEIIDELNSKEKDNKFEELILLFPQAIPDGDTSESDSIYETYFNDLIGRSDEYIKSVTYGGVSDGYYIEYSKKTNQKTTLPDNPPIKELADKWIIAKPSVTQTILDELNQEYQDFKEFLEKVLKVLKSGAEVNFSLIASANANGGEEYNQKLSERRIDSVYKEILQFGDGEKTLSDFIDNKLKIKKKSEGKKSKLKTDKYSSIDCSKGFKSSSTDGKGSMQAMLCRRVSVSEIKIKPNEEKPKTQTEEEKRKNNEGQLPQTNAAENNNTNNTQAQATTVKEISQTTVKDKTNKLRGDLTKRLLRKLLTECNYFEMVKETNPMIYDGIKSKIKNFQPAFHSITPEGLNARLTFLNQCVRPGDTIPTAVETGGETQFQYNDVFNSAFGTPPILVLRVGDFYHTKIIPMSLTFKYEDAKFDINPEGIGLQPMIATVSLSFDFIGGQGINNPVSELQNALSFNYYANTEMYDDRATITEDVLSEFDSEVLDIIKNEVGLIDATDKPQGSGAGNTIGNVKTNNLDIQTSAITGTIEYKTKMNEFVQTTGSYFNSLFFNLNILKDYLNLGGLLLYTKSRKYKEGYFDYLSGTSNSLITNILGKPENYQDRVDDLVRRAKKDVNELLTPPLAQVLEKNFTNDQIRKVKRKLKSMIDDKKQPYIDFLESAQTNIITEELKFINISDQVNYVINKRDGYVTKKGSVIIYDLSGKTEGVEASSDSPNTYEELKKDFIKIGTDLNDFMKKLDEFGIVPTGETFTYKDDFTTQLYLKEDLQEQVPPATNVFFMLFGTQIIENPDTFVNELAKAAVNNNVSNFHYTAWKDFIYNNLGFTKNNDTYVEKTNGGLVKDFKRSKDRLKNKFDDFKNDFLNDLLPNDIYKPFTDKKERVLDYSKQLTSNDTDVKNLKNVWSTVDSNDDKYNLKKKMN